MQHADQKRGVTCHNMGGPALGVNAGLAFGPIPESVKNRQRRVEAFVVTSLFFWFVFFVAMTKKMNIH